MDDLSCTTILTFYRFYDWMGNKVNNEYGYEEFYQSQRLFSLAFVNMLEQKGPDYTKIVLEKTFADTTFSIFPKDLTKENIRFTIMNFKANQIKFK